MNEAQGFLDQLREHPEDDVTRLVYADWLEDHDDPRAAYLRAEVELARMAEGDDGYEAAEVELVRLREGVEVKWIEQAGKRWDVVFQGCSPPHTIFAIKQVRQAVGCGLASAKCLVEASPSFILILAIRSVAEVARGTLMNTPPEARIQATIVPNSGEAKEIVYVSPTGGFEYEPVRWQPSA